MRTTIHLKNDGLYFLIIIFQKVIETIPEMSQFSLGLDSPFVNRDDIFFLFIKFFRDLVSKVFQLSHAFDLNGLNLCFEGFDRMRLFLVHLVHKLFQSLKLLIIILRQ